MSDLVMPVAIVAVALSMLAVLAAIVLRRLPFGVLHLAVMMPLVGWVARLARLRVPSAQEADRRLDRLFRTYWKWVGDAPLAGQFHRARRYLFLSGNAATRPASLGSAVALVALLAAETLSFAFLLGGKLWADASDDMVKGFAALITLTLVLLLAYFGARVGGMLRRRRALMEASPHALDPDVEVAGERPVGELTAPISLDEDQDRDQPRRVAGGPQRLLNRVARYPGDQGLVWPAVVYALVVLLIAYLQYDLRAISSVAASVASMPFDAGAIEVTARLGGGVDPTMGVANVFFVLIFLATQLFAVSGGMKHHFLGQDGERAYRITRGVDTYEALTRRYDARVRAADEALSALLTGFERYSVKPDRALFRARLAREGAAATSPEGGPPSTPAEAMAANSNVSPIAGAAGAA